MKRAEIGASTAPQRPPSATQPFTAAAGAAGFILTFVALREVLPIHNQSLAALLLMLGAAVPMLAIDLSVYKIHKQPSAGLDLDHWRPNWARSAVKCAGLGVTLCLIGYGYFLFDEYSDNFYDRSFDVFRIGGPIIILPAMLYIYIVDGYMRDPKDGYWHAGMLVLLNFREIDRRTVVQHFLGWAIKAFFLPLMFAYLTIDLDKLRHADLPRASSFKELFDYSFDFLFLADVCFAVVGYVVALRIVDTHIRSAEPTLFGWLVTLVCYHPFWEAINSRYLAYQNDRTWGSWLWDYSLAYVGWGAAIIALLSIYVWSTMIFGCRFSNLTNRGIITSGPYRFFKHPAYIAKNLSYWMISVPFLADPSQALRRCSLLLLVNGLYALRALTEERHLAQDPVYRQYQEWMGRHGLFSWARSALQADRRRRSMSRG